MTGEAIPSISGRTNLNPIGNSLRNTSLANKNGALAKQPNHNVNKKNPLSNLKTDEIEVQVQDQNNPLAGQGANNKSARFFDWLCCGPCIEFLKGSTTVHKMAITTATLIVTSLLVASPILFLISAAPQPSQHKDCFKEEFDCTPTGTVLPQECTDPLCKTAAASIQARVSIATEPCKDFKAFSCSNFTQHNLKFAKSAQEIADMQMMKLLTLNTTSGPFRKLGRLYESCLRQTINSSTIRLLIEKLGGYLPISALGPSSVAPLISKMNGIGPLPLIDIYYDLSYGRKPRILLIIDGPIDSSRLLENPVRWLTPKSPPIQHMDENVPVLLDELLKYFLPLGLSIEQRESEKQDVTRFIKDLNHIRAKYMAGAGAGFSNSYVVNNVSSLTESYPFLNWTELLPSNWTGTIVVRSSQYLEELRVLLLSHTNRVIHNSLLLLFALNALPSGYPTPLICTKATMSNMPEASSALFVSQWNPDHDIIKSSIYRAEAVFESMKAHLKRAPSLRGAALVRLSSLKIHAKPWPTLFNQTEALKKLNELEITSDDWFENVLRIYNQRRRITLNANISAEDQITWAYPTIARAFYDTLSHSIVVPLSIVLVPYFNSALPPYMHYATVGTTLGKEILRSVTKAFEDKLLRCVPASVEVFSNTSRMEMLIFSGGMQMAYHSMLAQTPLKAMYRLPGLELGAQQIFYLVTAQELCADSEYNGIDIHSTDFSFILSWLIAQGETAASVYKCQFQTQMRTQKKCDIW